MDIWSLYKNKTTIHGETKRDILLSREKRMLETKLSHTLSHHTAIVDGIKQKIIIKNSDKLNEKTIFSLNPENMHCGSYIEWMNTRWLVTSYDANSEIYAKAIIRQCNYLLKWVNQDGKICEQWCIIEDGTKYLTGEYEDRHFIVTRGDSRIAMTIARTEETVKFERTHRFLIDDSESPEKLAYALTKPLKVGWVYDNFGVYNFVLQEVASTDDDNHKLGIADYYKYFPKNINNSKSETITESVNTNQKRKAWL